MPRAIPNWLKNVKRLKNIAENHSVYGVGPSGT